MIEFSECVRGFSCPSFAYIKSVAVAPKIEAISIRSVTLMLTLPASTVDTHACVRGLLKRCAS